MIKELTSRVIDSSLDHRNDLVPLIAWKMAGGALLIGLCNESTNDMREVMAAILP